jgi:hypothetical protein
MEDSNPASAPADRSRDVPPSCIRRRWPLALAAGGVLVVWAALRPPCRPPADLRRGAGRRRVVGRWCAAPRRHEHAGICRPDDVAGAAAAVAGDHGRGGHRDGRRCCRRCRGGGDHQPRPPIRCPTRCSVAHSRFPARSRHRSRYAASAAAVTALASPGVRVRPVPGDGRVVAGPAGGLRPPSGPALSWSRNFSPTQWLPCWTDREREHGAPTFGLDLRCGSVPRLAVGCCSASWSP